MTGSEFKFLRRVRIHDGECGAVARALHHAAQKVALVRNEQSLISDECIPLRQAGSGKASDSTFNERKQMSTKTSIKRIALVAVSALGFGLLSVVPAKANITKVEILNASVVVPIGQTAGIPITMRTTAAAADANTVTITPTVATGGRPANSVMDIETAVDGSEPSFGRARWGTVANTNPAGWTATASTNAIVQDAAAGAAAGDYVVGTFEVRPDVPGTYVFELTPNANNLSAAGTEVIGQVTVVAVNTSSTLSASVSNAAGGTINRIGQDNPVITVSRPAGGSTLDGEIRLETIASADTADAPIGGNIGTGATLANVTIGTDSAAGRTFTFSTGSGHFTTAGTYTFRAYIDANDNDVRDSSEASVEVSFVLAGDARFVAFSADRSVVPAAGAAVTVVATVTDAGGRPTYLSASQVSVALTATDAAGTTGAATGAVTGLTADINGWTRIGLTNQYRDVLTYTPSADSVADTDTLQDEEVGFTYTMTGTVGLNTERPTVSFTVRDDLAAVATRLSLASATGLYAGVVGEASYTTVIPADTTAQTDANVAAGTYDAVAVSADPAVTSFSFTLTGTPAKVYPVTLIPGANTSSTRISAPTSVTTLADGTVTFVVTVTSPVAATATSTIRDSFTIVVDGTTDNNFAYTVTYRAPTAVWTLSPAATSNARVLEKSSNTVTAKLTDVYGRTLANRAYTVSVAGRNVSASAGMTDANGVATYTVNDTDTRAYSTTLGTATDAVTFSYADPAGLQSTVTGRVTFTYVTALTVVGSVSVTVDTADARVDQVEAAPGVPAASKTYTATVRTATGAAAGAGILVTFSGGADDIFVDGIRTGVTNASGQAAVSVYRQKTGFSNISATANGVSGSALAVRWVNDGGQYNSDGSVGAGVTTQDVSDARYVSVTATQSTVAGSAATVVARVTDRWGNPVSGVLVTWSLSGVGRAVTGADTTVGTDSNGNAQIQVTSLNSETGDMTVTATIPAVGGTINLAGKVVAANGAGTAFAASADVAGVTAGNFTSSGKVTFTKNTETSTADALLELAKAIGTGNSANAAADAALEAIDAANAATDAANLAAEAADAATVAAEEARDAADAATAAVEALASEVATLVAALKAQITTLANTVAKIAKRVKA